jgi:hypothetical protein
MVSFIFYLPFIQPFIKKNLLNLYSSFVPCYCLFVLCSLLLFFYLHFIQPWGLIFTRIVEFENYILPFLKPRQCV